MLTSFTLPANGLARSVPVDCPVLRTFHQHIERTFDEPPFLATDLCLLGDRRRCDQRQLALFFTSWLLNFKSPGQFRRNGTLIFCRCAKVNLVSDMANPEMKCD